MDQYFWLQLLSSDLSCPKKNLERGSRVYCSKWLHKILSRPVPKERSGRLKKGGKKHGKTRKINKEKQERKTRKNKKDK